MFDAYRRFSIYVPGTKLAAEVHAELTNAFGGSTGMSVQGFYRSNAGDLVVEPITVVWTLVSLAQSKQAYKLVESIAKRIKDIEKQESVLWTVDSVSDVVFT